MADIIALIYEDHDWFRRRFFLLDECSTPAELTGVWDPLALRLEAHADVEERVFYPVLLNLAAADDAEDETEDAIDDHNEIRDAVADAGRHPVGSPEWYEAVGRARTENGKHLDEEEREALPDFTKHSTAAQRHDLAMQWLQWYAAHPAGQGADRTDKDPADYIEEHS